MKDTDFTKMYLIMETREQVHVSECGLEIKYLWDHIVYVFYEEDEANQYMEKLQGWFPERVFHVKPHTPTVKVR